MGETVPLTGVVGLERKGECTSRGGKGRMTDIQARE
jgi:hypothetical protein